MPGQLFHHPETEDRFFLGVMKDVQTNQSGIQVSVVGNHGQIWVADSLWPAQS